MPGSRTVAECVFDGEPDRDGEMAETCLDIGRSILFWPTISFPARVASIGRMPCVYSSVLSSFHALVMRVVKTDLSPPFC